MIQTAARQQTADAVQSVGSDYYQLLDILKSEIGKLGAGSRPLQKLDGEALVEALLQADEGALFDAAPFSFLKQRRTDAAAEFIRVFVLGNPLTTSNIAPEKSRIRFLGLPGGIFLKMLFWKIYDF